MRASIAAVSGAVLLCSCASVDFQALKPDGVTPDGPPGLRYYLPKPYLIVTEIPARWATANSGGSALAGGPPDNGIPAGAVGGNGPPAGAAGGGPRGAGGAPKPAASAPADGSNPSDPSNSTPATTTDTSYLHQISQYQVKLVYLPDYNHPMTMTVKGGWGSVSVAPTLQDGWMLTSMQANTDSQTAAILTAIAGVVTAYKTPAKAAASGASGPSAGGGPGIAAATPASSSDRGLPPGLYSFNWTPSSDPQRSGLVDFCAVRYFSSDSTSSVPLCSATR